MANYLTDVNESVATALVLVKRIISKNLQSSPKSEIFKYYLDIVKYILNHILWG